MAKNDKLTPKTKASETPPMKHATQAWRRNQIKRMVDRGKDFEMVLINTEIPREIALPIYLELKAEQTFEMLHQQHDWITVEMIQNHLATLQIDRTTDEILNELRNIYKKA